MGCLACTPCGRRIKATRTISACEARGLGDVNVNVIIGPTLGGHNASDLIYLNKIIGAVNGAASAGAARAALVSPGTSRSISTLARLRRRVRTPLVVSARSHSASPRASPSAEPPGSAGTQEFIAKGSASRAVTRLDHLVLDTQRSVRRPLSRRCCSTRDE